MGNKTRKKNIKYRLNYQSRNYQSGGDTGATGEPAATPALVPPVVDTVNGAVVPPAAPDNGAVVPPAAPDNGAVVPPAAPDNGAALNAAESAPVVSSDVETHANSDTNPTIQATIDDFLKNIPPEQQDNDIKQKIEQLTNLVKFSSKQFISELPLVTSLIETYKKNIEEIKVAQQQTIPSQQQQPVSQQQQTIPSQPQQQETSPSYNEGNKVCVDDVNGTHVLIKVPKGELVQQILELIKANNLVSYEVRNPNF